MKGHVRSDGVQSSVYLHARKKYGISAKGFSKTHALNPRSIVSSNHFELQHSSLDLSLPEIDMLHETVLTMIIQPLRV